MSIRNNQNMMISVKTIVLSVLLTVFIFAGEWQENPLIFNTSGVPSLSFSQPRLADLDADGDLDLIIGNSGGAPYYMTNVGSSASPKFTHIEDIFADVSSLDAEVAAFADMDADGDPDMICGGYRGLSLYLNAGNAVAPVYVKSENFFSGITGGSYPVPDVADIDNDGDYDLVLGYSEDGSIKVFYNTGTDSAAVFIDGSSLQIGDVGLYAYPVFHDLDNDGDQDIISGRDGMGFYYYKNNGSPESPNWQRNDAVFNGLGNDFYFNSPEIADINGDGKADLIYGNASGPLQYYRNSGTESSPAWTKNTSLFGGIIDVGGASSPVFFDLDSDGDLDLFTGTQMGDVKYYENTGTANGPAWKTSPDTYSALKHSIYSSADFADVNGDGLPDALVGDLSGNIYFHEKGSGGYSDSNVLTIAALGGWSAPRFIDMNKDGDMDIAAGNEEGELFYFENLGTATSPLWSESSNYFQGIDVGYNAVPAFADIDFDGDYDLICGNGFRELFYFENVNGDWVEDTTMFEGITGEQNTAPAMADLDGDGDRDLIFGNYGGTFSYFENRHEVVAVHDRNSSLPEKFSLNAYPNPFNPVSNLYLSLPSAGHVTLSVHDLRGRHIRTLVDEYREAGAYTLQFLADAGMPSGVYLLHLDIDGRGMTSIKLLLMK